MPLEYGTVPEVYTSAYETEFGQRPSEYMAAQLVSAWVWLHSRFWWVPSEESRRLLVWVAKEAPTPREQYLAGLAS